MKKYYSIYKLNIGERFYIGCTTNLGHRLHDHLHGASSQPRVRDAIAWHAGRHNCELLAFTYSRSKARYLEKYYIYHYNATDPRAGGLNKFRAGIPKKEPKTRIQNKVGGARLVPKNFQTASPTPPKPPEKAPQKPVGRVKAPSGRYVYY